MLYQRDTRTRLVVKLCRDVSTVEACPKGVARFPLQYISVLQWG